MPTLFTTVTSTCKCHHTSLQHTFVESGAEVCKYHGCGCKNFEAVERTYCLSFSDLEMGHPDLGFMSREDCRDPDEEDVRYARFLAGKGFKGVRVWNGKAKISLKKGK